MKQLYKEILFSTLILISSFIITVLIHESGHASFVKYFHLKGTIYQNHVEYNYLDADEKQSIWICLGGSIFSLLQLMISILALIKLKISNRFSCLFVCWLTFCSSVQFFGYFIVGGVTKSWNDISGVYEITNTYLAFRIIIALLAVFMFRLVMKKLNFYFIKSMNLKFSLKIREQLNAIILIPSIFVSIILSVLSTPITNIISIIYPLSFPLYVLTTYFTILKSNLIKIENNDIKNTDWIISLIVITIALTIDRWLSTGHSF